MSELDEFKSSINLSEYAASLGYLMDRRASSRNSVVMRHGNGDKIVIDSSPPPTTGLTVGVSTEASGGGRSPGWEATRAANAPTTAPSKNAKDSCLN